MKGNRLLRLSAGMLAGVLLLSAPGCAPWRPAAWWNQWLDPSKTIARPCDNQAQPILPTVDPLDETHELAPNSTAPTVDDLRWSTEEYVLGPGDVIDISILDLFAEGQEALLRRQVSDAGYIDLPLLEQRLRVGGLAVEQARRAIANAYMPNILRHPTVSISLIAQRQNTFSILGAVARPGTYNILRHEFRLLEALALAGDVTQTNIDYIYVIRLTPEARELGPIPVPQPQSAPAPVLTPENLPPLPGTTTPSSQPGVAPSATPSMEPGMEPGPGTITVPTVPGATQPSQPATDQGLNELLRSMGAGAAQPETAPVKPSIVHLAELLDGTPASASNPATASAPTSGPGAEGELVWVFQNGQWVQVPAASLEATTAPAPGAPAAPTAPGEEAPAPAPGEAPRVGPRVPVVPEAQAQAPTSVPAAPGDRFGWEASDLTHLARIIAISLPKLKEGDPRLNIIIRDNDIIHVPMLEVGEFYVTGEVSRPGVYSLTGRKVTLKMALAAAGDFGPLAWPSNTVLIRRVGNNQEIMVPINMDLIMAGKEPDIFLKPNDVIAVGTHIAAPFMAVIRSAFRMTYGFGFIYDRNYAERNLLVMQADRSIVHEFWGP